MFGVPKSINILRKINSFASKDKNRKKYQIIITPPFTLLESFSKYLKSSNIIIGSQNCYKKKQYSSDTGAVSSYMIKSVGIKHTLIGHSDNRAEGDTEIILKDKVKFALNNKLKVIYCVGENRIQKQKKQTFSVIKRQLIKVLNKQYDKKNIIVAYEPIWSIGSGKIPSQNELFKITIYIKKILSKIFVKSPAVLYGGSVDEKNIKMLKEIPAIDGFLIGGASKSSKKFIDIIKNYYR
tara:strand:+ start:1348 stop:2061 length:714 start_codon:yes stop_codon:yes gene_type:complete